MGDEPASEKVVGTVSRPGLVVITIVLSAVMLAYEILLTRIASVLLTSQYIFLIVGVSLLGISIGAIVEFVLARRSVLSGTTQPAIDVVPVSALLVLALVLLLKVGPDTGTSAIGIAAALPFAASGFVLSRLFRVGVKWTGILYAADLAGAAIGALVVPLLISVFGPTQAILLLALVLSVVGVFFGVRNKVIQLARGTAVVVTALIFFLNTDNALLGEIPVGKDPDKDLYRLTTMQEGSVETVESRWSTFGRTDLVRFKGDSTTMPIFIDGAAGTNMIRFDGSFDDSSITFTHAIHQFGGLMPLLNLSDDQKNSALIIGPGGGRDVLIALKAGFKQITAVDINPQMVAIVKDYKAFNGGIYTDFKNVNVVVAEGRNYLRHSDRQYDLITLFMPITKSSQSLNSFALSETYLFTKDAFRDYYDHLADKGTLLVMAHSMPEAAKLLTTALKALQEGGMTTDRAMKHTYILGSPMMPLFGLSKAGVDSAESEFLHQVAHFTMFDCGLSFIPGVEQQLVRPPLSTTIDAGVPMMNPIFINLAEGMIPVETVEYETGLNLVPVTDDRPFFSRYDFAMPQVLFSLLWLSLGILGAVLLIPIRWFQLRIYVEGKQFSWWLPLFVVAIAFGYIVIELSLFQKLVFYLGDPSRTFALLLAALLAGSGTGSLVTSREGPRAATIGGAVAAVLAISALALVPWLFSLVHTSSGGVQQALAALVLFIQGIPMGVMFPIALRLGARQFGDAAVPWLWAINGSASVAGSALVIIIAMSFGYSWSLALGATCYALAALCILLFAKRDNTFSQSNEREVLDAS
jgi:Spermine/spermidine synthase domain